MDYNVFVRLLVCVLLLVLVACRSAHEVDKKISPDARIMVGETLGTPENCGGMIKQARPEYPEEAKKVRIEGMVRLGILITKTGEVRYLRVISGNPALIPTAVEAVRQWRYGPCRLNSELVERKTTVDISFTLHQ